MWRSSWDRSRSFVRIKFRRSISAQLSRAVKADEINVVEPTQPLRLARQSKDNWEARTFVPLSFFRNSFLHSDKNSRIEQLNQQGNGSCYELVSITSRGLTGLYRRIVYMGLNHCRVSHRGDSRGPARSSGGPIHDSYLALCSFFCGRSYDLCSGRRIDPRFADQWQHRRCDPRSHGWLCHYDDPRRRSWIKCHHLVTQMQGDFFI